jgi:hypothetical protein
MLFRLSRDTVESVIIPIKKLIAIQINQAGNAFIINMYKCGAKITLRLNTVGRKQATISSNSLLSSVNYPFKVRVIYYFVDVSLV